MSDTTATASALPEKAADDPPVVLIADKPTDTKAAAPPPKAVPVAPPAPATTDKSPAAIPPAAPAKAAADPAPAPAAPVVKAAATFAPPAKPAMDPVDQEHVGMLNEILSNYVGYLSNRIVTPAAFKAAATAMSSVVLRVLARPTLPMMQALWDFFVAHKDDVLEETRALSGVDSLDVKTRFKMEIVYTLFRMAVNGVDVGNAKKINLTLIQPRLRCPALIIFLQAQAKLVVAKKTP